MTQNKTFYVIIVLSVIVGSVSLFMDSTAWRVVFALVQFALFCLAIFTLSPAYHRIMARWLWDEYWTDAEWEHADTVDPYCAEYNITLEVYGYFYTGDGYITAGEKEIGHITCICPDGSTVNIM